jgi:DNA ligase (NAD+)
LEDVHQIVKRLLEATEAYASGHPILTDADFDLLEDKLRDADPQNNYFTRVGSPAPQGGTWTKTAHRIPMGSLKKCQLDAGGADPHAELRAWWPGHSVCLTEKLDGISVNLVYKNHRLVAAVTRGDGLIGEDILENVLQMEGAVRRLPPSEPSEVSVRGEIICRKSSFAAHFPGESNTRNTAAGTSKRRGDNAKARYLTVLAYHYLPDGFPLVSRREELGMLDHLGFLTPKPRWASSLEEVLGVFDQYVQKEREALDWDIDGLVVDVDHRDTREGMGSSNMRPEGSRALKFPHHSAQTTLRDVVWQVGKSGRLTPVAVFDPVPLAGAMVARASLHNPDYIEQLVGSQRFLAFGDQIIVERRNDVIPGVAELLARNARDTVRIFDPPTTCPSCTHPTTRDGAYLTCPNSGQCSAQISGHIKRWIAKVGVKHFGDALVDHLCETGQVESIHALYELDPDDIASQEDRHGRLLGGVATRAFKNLHSSTTIPLHVFVGALGIPLMGRSMVKILVDAGYDSLLKLMRATAPELAAIPGVGETKAQAFVEGYESLRERAVISSLLSHITIEARQNGRFTGVSVCMTGFRDSDMEAEVERQGGVLKSSVSKDLKILVSKDPSSTSGKAQKARQYGVEILSPEEMWARLND